jgi:hypothetical protein
MSKLMQKLTEKMGTGAVATAKETANTLGAKVAKPGNRIAGEAKLWRECAALGREPTEAEIAGLVEARDRKVALSRERRDMVVTGVLACRAWASGDLAIGGETIAPEKPANETTNEPNETEVRA